MKIKKIIEALNELAPDYMAESYDNPGFLVGDENSETDIVMVCLDCDERVVEEASRCGAGLIVSHHPIMFGGTTAITTENGQGRTIMSLINNKISLFSMHTNLDSAPGGLNDYFAEVIGIKDTCIIESAGEGYGFGRIGKLNKPMQYGEFIDRLKKVLSLKKVRYTGDISQTVETIAFCTGSGGELGAAAYAMGADVYISGDIKYNVLRESYENGKKIIDAGHYETEIIAARLIKRELSRRFGELSVLVSETNICPYNIK